jgi:virulence-associated protein VagC
MVNPTKAAMKRVAKPLVEREDDWQAILEEVKDTFEMEASEENREIIMDVIRECEDELGMRL